MLLEFYAQSFDLTTIYSVYITLLLSVIISAFWFLNSAASVSKSLPVKFRFQPSASEAAYNNKVEIGLNFHLLILKCIKIKIEPGDEAISYFSPKITIDN